jgi:hypothetical protein
MRLLLVLTMLSTSLLTFLQTEQESGKNPHGRIDMECSLCHDTQNWQINPDSMRFNHETTGFNLRGQHSNVTCRHCHSNLVFSHIGVSCVDCHEDVHKAELGFQCQDCHTPASWNNVQDIFETHSGTRFPLVGVHAIVDCESCHSMSDPYEYKTIPLTCEQCHHQVYLSSANPNHIQAQFSTDCEVCHSLVAPSWYQTSYLHPQSFLINGAHIRVECNDCHQSGFTGTPNRCEDCHMKDYLASQDPNHAKFGFPTVCETCHNENHWGDAVFDHLESSGFELQGAHLTIQCTRCHVNNQINGLPRECFGCHEADYNGVEDPGHVSGQFSHDCLQCHSEIVWSPSTFDHNQTQFPLSGAHVTVACSDCHINGQFTGLTTDCWSCHENDYLGVTDPNHAQGQFSHDCLQCHSEQAWSPATLNHDDTNFPLTGAHKSVNCTDCHINGQYTGLPTDCWSCHENDYVGITDPNHTQGQFSHDCLLCHTDQAWSPATFNHDDTNFPLTGAHVTLDCSSCHAAGYANTPVDCFACHEAEYNNTTDPNHQTAEFPVQCETCHSTINWDQTTWDHDGLYFPIYSGTHREAWDACIDCHISPADYKVYECIFCHEHDDPIDLAEKHKDEEDYLYQSSACYDCHPDGIAEGD